jgi:hypothetical protein
VVAEVLELVMRVVGSEGAQREPDHLGCLDLASAHPPGFTFAGGRDERGPRELSVPWAS